MSKLENNFYISNNFIIFVFSNNLINNMMADVFTIFNICFLGLGLGLILRFGEKYSAIRLLKPFFNLKI